MKVLALKIEMISWTDKNGVIKPVRFRVEEKDEMACVGKVLAIHTIDESKIAGQVKRIYKCEVQLRNMRKLCVIRYDIGTTTWEIYKI